jgi:adenylate cyclase
MAERNNTIPAERRIELRKGVNVGDIIIDEGDIYGDGVNVAARLEALAEPGSICVSRVVRDEVRDKLSYALEDMREQTVKNIARPVRVYAMKAAAVATLPPLLRRRRTGPHAASPRRDAPRLSIDVSPFANLSNVLAQGTGRHFIRRLATFCASGPFEAAHVALSSAATTR